MCVVSAIMDYGRQTIPDKYPNYFPINPNINIPSPFAPVPPSRAEFEALQKEVQELAKLVRQALEYDKNTDQRHCEDPQKVKFFVELAKKAKVNIDDLIKELQK